jgi:hypothetical protein
LSVEPTVTLAIWAIRDREEDTGKFRNRQHTSPLESTMRQAMLSVAALLLAVLVPLRAVADLKIAWDADNPEKNTAAVIKGKGTYVLHEGLVLLDKGVWVHAFSKDGLFYGSQSIPNPTDPGKFEVNFPVHKGTYTVYATVQTTNKTKIVDYRRTTLKVDVPVNDAAGAPPQAGGVVLLAPTGGQGVIKFKGTLTPKDGYDWVPGTARYYYFGLQNAAPNESPQFYSQVVVATWDLDIKAYRVDTTIPAVPGDYEVFLTANFKKKDGTGEERTANSPLQAAVKVKQP